MTRRTLTVCLLVLALSLAATASAAGTTAGRRLQGSEVPESTAATDESPESTPEYAPNLYEAVVKAGALLSTTKVAIENANLKEQLLNATLSRTFLAMDNEAWQDLASLLGYRTLQDLLNDPTQLDMILRNHMVPSTLFTSFWPAYGSPAIAVESLLDDRPDGSPRVLWLKTDENGDYDALGYLLTAELSPIPSRVNLRAGSSVMHVVHDVDKQATLPF